MYENKIFILIDCFPMLATENKISFSISYATL
jgi:hypothetical protein